MLRSRSSSGGNLAKLYHQAERGRVTRARCKAFCLSVLMICGGSLLGARRSENPVLTYLFHWCRVPQRTVVQEIVQWTQTCT